MKMLFKKYLSICLPFILCLSFSVIAETKKISVLDFELYDLTNTTPTPESELKRQASLAPFLSEALKDMGYEIVPIDKDLQDQANKGIGYLYRHADETAKLGKPFGADIVIVGHIHKPSFLFAYFKARIIDVKTGRHVAEHVVEAKGRSKNLTQKSAINLAELLNETIGKKDKE